MSTVEEGLGKGILDAAATVRFSLTAVSANGEGPRVRLALADTHLGVAPFPGVRVDLLEIDIPGGAGSDPNVFKNRRGDLRRLRFSISESALEAGMRAALADSGLESIGLRLFPDHVRIYAELAGDQHPKPRAVLCASVDVDESGAFILSFYDLRVFGRLPAGLVPSALLDHLVPEKLSRHIVKEGATRVVFRPHALLLGHWLPAAGWKVPDVSRATDRHIALRGDRVYVELSQTSTPGLVSETSSARNLSAFEYAEAERLFADGEKKLAAGDLAGAAAVYRPHADPETGHPFAMRRLAWILVAQADGAKGLDEAKRLAEGLRRRFPDDAVAAETLAALAIASGDRSAAAEAYESLAEREAEENDLRGRVFAELTLGELYAAGKTPEDLELARGAWEAALALDPECLFAREEVAEIYARTGEHARAIHGWWKVLEQKHDAAERKALLLRIATAQLEGLHDSDAAISVFRQAQDGDDPEAPTVAAWEGLAKAYAAKGDAPAAIRQLERVAERSLATGDTKAAARANFAIGELWAGPLKRPESALLRFNRALELDPLHPGSLERRYALCKERKAWTDAIATGAKLAEVVEPGKGIALQLEMARIAESEMHDPATAAACAAKALVIDPASTPAREAAEHCFATANDLAGLAALYLLVVERAPQKVAYELRMRRGVILATALDDANGAVLELATAVTLAPDPVTQERARAAQADLLRTAGRLAELREVRAAQWGAAKPSPGRARIAIELGRISRELSDAELAAEWFEKAAVDDPDQPEAFAALAELAAQRGDRHAHVEALLRQAAATSDGAARVALELAAAEMLLTSLEDAERARQTALAAIGEGDAAKGRAAVPIPADAWRILGRAARALGDLDGAAKSLERWLEEAERQETQVPARVAAMAAEIASVHAERKDDAAELAWLERRIQADPIDVPATRRAASIARRLGPRSKAAVLVEAEGRLEKDRALAAGLYLEAGRLWEAEGDSTRAEVCYRHAASATPQDEEPLEALSDLLLGEGRNEDAVELWRNGAEASANALAVARWRRAAVIAQTRSADPETAARCWARLLAIDDADKQALTFLAERARAAGAWGKARDLYERLAAVSADAPIAEKAALALKRAEACERDGDPRSAEERYRLAAKLDPAARDPWKAIRRLATAASRFDDAAKACEEEAARVPEVGEKSALLFEAGRLALERLNDPKRAVTRFREVLDVSPGNLPALDALESVLGVLGDFPALIEVLREKARRLRDPRRKADLLVRAAELGWEKLRSLESASEDALAARAAVSDDPRPVALLEKVYRASDRADLLAPILDERAIAAEGDAKTAFIVEAALLRADVLGDLDRAATDLEHAVLEGSGGVELYRALSSVQERRKDMPRLGAALARLGSVQSGREKALTLLALARVTAEQGDSAAAIGILVEARAADPADREIALELRARLTATNRWADLAALEVELAAKAADPAQAAAGFRRAGQIFRERLDDAASAVRSFRRALSADPDDEESLAAADQLLVARGDHGVRAEMFRERLRLRPHDAVAREGLLAALAASGSWTDLEAELKPMADAEPVGGPNVRRLILAYRSAGRWKDLVRFLEARVFSGELAARELLEALFAEREDWRGLAEFNLRLGEGKGGRDRARAVAAAAAVLRERMGDLDRARNVIRDAVAERPEDGELFDGAAETFESIGDMEGLRDLIVDAAGWHQGGDKGRLLRRAAQISRERLGDSARALALAKEALAVDAEDDAACEMAADILIGRHDWQGLVALWTDRGERGRDPKKRAACYTTAGQIAKARLGDPYRAAAAFRAALLHDPDDTEAQKGAEDALEAAEKWDELTSMRAARAAREDGGQPRVHALLSAAVVARDKLKDVNRALELFKQAAAEAPADPLPVDAVAALLAQENRWGDLARWLLEAAAHLPDAAAVERRLNAAEILLDPRVEEPDAPIAAGAALTENLRAADPEAASHALDRGAMLLTAHGNAQLLAAFYEAGLASASLGARRAEILGTLGTLYSERLSDPRKAVSAWRRALELDPGRSDAFAGLEAFYRSTEDWEGLLAVWETDASFSNEPAHKAARYAAMAQLRAEKLGDPAGAADDYRRALEADPSESGFAARYESSLENSGRWEELVSSLLSRAAKSAAPATAASLTIRAADLIADKINDPSRAATLYEATRTSAAHPEEPILGLDRVYRRMQAWDRLAPILEARAELPGVPHERARLYLEAGILRRVKLADPEKALVDLGLARELDDTSVDPLREMREIHRAKGDHAALDRVLEAELALSEHEPPEARAALAYERGVVARDGLLNPASAVRHFGSAVELFPADARAVRALAEQAEVIGAWPLARQEWSRLASLTEGEERPRLHDRAASAARREGDLHGVAEHLEDAVEAAPERLEAWNALADVYLELRRWDEARLVLGDMLARSSKGGDAALTVAIYYRLGLAERLVGQNDKAAGRLKRLLAVDPDHVGALTLLAEIDRERTDWAALSEVLPRLAKVVPEKSRAGVWRELASVLEHRLGRPVDAMDAYGNALVADANDYEAMWRLSELSYQNGRFDVFLATWARLAARETAPARKLALAYRAGEALRRTGRPKEAAREYERALEIDPAHLPSWSALAALLEETREWRRAAAAYDGALRALGDASPENSVQLLVRRGVLLSDKVGDYEGAAADLKRAVAIHPDDLGLRFRLAAVLAKAKGRTQDSIGELHEILRRDPFRPEVYRALGEIHAGSQNFDRAFAAFSALALLAPDDIAAKSFLEANKSKIDQGMLKALDDQTRAERLAHAGTRSPLAPGLAALADSVGALHPSAIDRASLIPIDLTAGTPLARMIDSIRARLGLSALALFVRPAAVPAKRDTVADLVAVEGGESPALLVDDTLAGAVPDRRGALFLLGKHLERLKSGQWIYLRLSHDEIDQLAGVLKRAFDPALTAPPPLTGLSSEQLGAMIKSLRKTAPRKSRREIEDLAAQVTPEKLQAWVAAQRHTENRAGLLVANDLTQSVKVVLALDPDLGKYDLEKVPDRVAHLKKSDEVAELLHFLLSEDYFALRKSLGLTLDARR